MPLQASTHAIHLKGKFEGRRPASQRGVWGSERCALLGFSEGLAAFLFGGSPRIKKRQDSASRQPPDPGSVHTSKTRTLQVLIAYRLASH